MYAWIRLKGFGLTDPESPMISVAIDWGSSSFRAYRFDAMGEQVDCVSDTVGIKFVTDSNFEAVMRQQVGDWLIPGDTVLLSGMISSRNGWLESRYLECPAQLGQLVDAGRRLQLDDVELIFLPGVSQSSPPDVMRGEELQLIGAAATHGKGLYVIPGTHSKWAAVCDGTINQFKTIPTGELFDLLLSHSLIGALASDSEWDEFAFAKGVRCGFINSTPVSDLFSARSAVLMGQLSDIESYAWLSGLLIGNEIREGQLAMPDDPDMRILIGSLSLSEKYLRAFQTLGIEAICADQYVTLHGFQTVIRSLSS